MTLFKLAQMAQVVFVTLAMSACANYAGGGLKPGISTRQDVIAVMGPPAMDWKNSDGSAQLAYPRGPSGPHTFMVQIAPDERLKSIENVLEYKHFSQIIPGKTTQADVLRLLGPSMPQWTSYYKARDELVWEWLYCDESGMQAKFDVLFDGMDGPVRTTSSRPDYRGRDGVVPRCGRLTTP